LADLSPYQQAITGAHEFVGKLEAYDDYDGNDDWAGRSWHISLDEGLAADPAIVWVEIEDVLQLYDGRRVKLTIEAVDG
jgi:hypothetical protein